MLGLADARGLARAALREVGLGHDPSRARRETRRADTVEALAAEYIERHAKPNKRSWREDDRILRAEVLPLWQHRPLRDIRRRDIRELVEAVADRGAGVMANRVLALVRKMFNFAVEREWIEASPAAMVRRPGRERRRDRVLSDNELRTFWTALDRESAALASAFRLRLITAQRGGEVHNMRWADVDFNSRWWTIPAKHAKNGLPHRVPLTDPALKILLELETTKKPDTEFVLAGARGSRQRSEVLSRLGLADFRGHDLRRTAASQMASEGVPRLVIGKVLNHAEPSVTAVYDRHSYDREKREALSTWSRQLQSILSDPTANRACSAEPLA